MKHTYEEVYKICGQQGLYTMDYLVAHNIPLKPYRAEEGEAHPCYHMGIDRGTKNIYTANGVQTVYTYGEKTWFDTEAERDAYRVRRTAEREEQIKKNALIKTIMEHYKTMTLEELKQVVATL